MEEESQDREESGSDAGDPDDPDEEITTRSIKWPSYLHDDVVEKLIRRRPVLAAEIQGVLLFRRPLASFALVLFLNSTLFFCRWAQLPFLSLVVIAIAVYLSWTFFGPVLLEQLKELLFPGECPMGGPLEENRIRSPDEFAAFLTEIVSPILIVAKLVYAVRTDPSPLGHVSISFMFFSLMMLTATVDFFWIVVIVVNGVLCVPGVWLHPVSRQYWRMLTQGD
jgi:hypothetical protein